MTKVHLFMLHNDVSFSWKGGVLYVCIEILSPIVSASLALDFLYHVCQCNE